MTIVTRDGILAIRTTSTCLYIYESREFIDGRVKDLHLLIIVRQTLSLCKLSECDQVQERRLLYTHITTHKRYTLHNHIGRRKGRDLMSRINRLETKYRVSFESFAYRSLYLYTPNLLTIRLRQADDRMLCCLFFYKKSNARHTHDG